MSQDPNRRQIEKLRQLQRREENLMKLAERDGYVYDAVQHEKKAASYEESAERLREGRAAKRGKK